MGRLSMRETGSLLVFSFQFSAETTEHAKWMRQPVKHRTITTKILFLDRARFKALTNSRTSTQGSDDRVHEQSGSKRCTQAVDYPRENPQTSPAFFATPSKPRDGESQKCGYYCGHDYGSSDREAAKLTGIWSIAFNACDLPINIPSPKWPRQGSQQRYCDHRQNGDRWEGADLTAERGCRCHSRF